MINEYQIHLNFLAVEDDFPNFIVYRRLRASPQEVRPNHGAASYRMPVKILPIEDKCAFYWVSFCPADGLEACEVMPTTNKQLTCRAMYWALVSAAGKVLNRKTFQIPQSSFFQEISFIQRHHDEGNEVLEVQPYFLHASKQFGYLIDFRFHLRDGVPFSRRVQQLSLSLDRSGKRNLGNYLDRNSKIREFCRERQDVLGSLFLPAAQIPIRLAPDFTPITADRLRTKTYVFAEGKEAKSQFKGLRDHGPLAGLPAIPRLLFIFREQDRQAARRLAMGLRGTGNPNFPGFKALFRCDLEIDSSPIVLPDLSRNEMETALTRVKSERQAKPVTLPVLILPAEDHDSYLTHKAIFSQAEIPTQVCTLPLLQSDNSMKWAIGNIALQIFCKAGGQPWKVLPTEAERCLIIGISQSHKLRKVEGTTKVEKYFAFSVMTDSSGLFQKVQVLGQGDDEGGYLDSLRRSLQEELNREADNYARIVVHTSFKLKRREIAAIRDAVRKTAGSTNGPKTKFAVIKVNHKSRFFGINRSVNSLVPYEATRVRLGPGEYLVWFEGIFPDCSTVTKAFPGPTHIQMLRMEEHQGIPEGVLLQDLVNLSGANWRGFNAKSAPVSVFYCHLVADMVHDFYEKGLPLPAVHEIRPWFL